jgi:glutathione S-transferase
LDGCPRLPLRTARLIKNELAFGGNQNGKCYEALQSCPGSKSAPGPHLRGGKGIELALQDIDILAGQSRTPEFLAKNSSGGVPVLELDDGSCLAESVAICRYLGGTDGSRAERTAVCRWRPFTIADITALVAIDIGGRLADIKIASKLANLTRWHKASAKA